jgi:hypothetical protein
MNGSDGLWYVQLSDGDVHRVTLDQLDEGFQAGHVDANTMVLAAGAAQWAKLGQLAGIDEAPPPRVAPSEPRPPPPVAMRIDAPPPLRSPPRAQAAAPPRVRSPAGTSVLSSYRPVSVDLSELDLEMALPRGSGKRWFVAVAAIAMVGSASAVAVTQPLFAQPYLSRLGLHGISLRSVAAAALPPRLVTIDRPPSVTALSAVPVFTPLPATGSSPVPPDRIADDPRHSPPATGKPHRAKAKAHKIGLGRGASHGPSVQKDSPTLTTGGNKYDPLSSSI